MEGQFNNWDLISYPGLVAVVIALVGGLKKLWPAFVKGKEAHLALILSLGIGVAAKLTIPNAFANVQWVVFLISLLFVTMAAGAAHDRLVNPLLANKKNPTQK